MTRRPDFDDLVGSDVPAEERERLRRVHDLLVEAGPPPELSPELESVPWPEDALGPLWGRRGRRRPVFQRPAVLAATLATAVVAGFFLGQLTSGDTTTSIDARRTVTLHGTVRDPAALATLQLARPDRKGNWSMVLRVEGLPKLANGGYYDLYLTKDGEPLVSCGTFNTDGETVVRFTAAYNLERFDENGWVVVRKTPGHFEPTDVVLRPAV